jgi:thiamine kinase-like enzyme
LEWLARSPVASARRTFGGYGPSATFVVRLADGRQLFFKAVYPLPEGSSVKWMLDDEERVYETLQEIINPWAPRYYGSLRLDGWHGLVLEAIHGERVIPWTESKARRAAHSFAEFHASTVGRQLPEWLPRDRHREFAVFWREIADDASAQDRLATLGATGAARWLDDSLPTLVAAEQELESAGEPYALLHSDTRSDNVRLQGNLLRIFDWPFAFAGPAEFDVAAFAQAIASEGGPDAEQVAGWYSDVLATREDLLTAAITGLAGYFADRAARPEVPGLPRLRSVQRQQLKASLAWAARRLSLPDPEWLRRVPD